MNTVTIGTTTKGRRVWLQGITSHMPHHAPRYSVYFTDTTIMVYFSSTGKRKVTTSKGGIIDLVGTQVTTWAHDATMALVSYGIDSIAITRAN